MQKFIEIVERIEIVRKNKDMNKSNFAAKIGIRAQTYNNFIGAQRSKPSVELIHGVVSQFQVNPLWLLNGTGTMYLEEVLIDDKSVTGTGDSRSKTAQIGRQSARLDNHQVLVNEVKIKMEELQVLLSRLQKAQL